MLVTLLAVSQAIMDAVKSFDVLCKRAGVRMLPKNHLVLHIGQRAQRQGNPRLHATWKDESLNRQLASIGRSAHRHVWELRILAHFEKLCL